MRINNLQGDLLMMKIGLALPTYNANTHNDFNDVLKRINAQSNILSTIKIFDSESTDDTVAVAKKNNIEVIEIKKKDFSHSKTRTRIAQEMLENKIDYLIFMTQDVFLQPQALQELVSFIKNNKLALAYGKQEVDITKSNIFEAYARKFNYGEKNILKKKQDIEKYGIKTIFCSDAFAIYDLRMIKKVDFFGEEANFSEDMLIADKLISKGCTIGYCAKSKVYHSHNYSILDEYNRYKEIGYFHAQFSHVLSKYNGTTSEGIKLAISECYFLLKEKKVHFIPESITRNFMKFMGMKKGKKNYHNSHMK